MALGVKKNWILLDSSEAVIETGHVDSGKSISVWIPGVSPCISYSFEVTVARQGGGKVTKTLTSSNKTVTFTNMIGGDYSFTIRNKNSQSLYTMYQITYNA
ncbi:hypothetical protein [Lihuaxuella thermophila]|uniref:Uncharacterized protein n=1 Tax=Lihuaxuella thermophila TaxID=1173111 RepID=A0A1H8JA85_9BACL|nr:hypothetical protein [Lihuaxuella thermophila]SEN77589.1 hypothetical protein SAMN05444955_1237 [Lihuaxuella thermophila]